jgi:hypothetical protein
VGTEETSAPAPSWVAHHDRHKAVLDRASPAHLEEQLRAAERDLPALYATYSMLALLLYQEVLRLDPAAGPDGQQTILAVIPPRAIAAALRLSTVFPDRDELCRRLNAWAAAVHFDKLRRGILEEPAHYCAE